MGDLEGHTHSLVVKMQRKFFDLAHTTHKLEVSMVLIVIDYATRNFCICHLSLTSCRIEGGLED